MKAKTAAAFALVLVAAAAPARAEEAPTTPVVVRPPKPHLRLAILVGYDRWDDAAELVPPNELPGAPVVGVIKADGATLDLTSHWTVRRGPRVDLLVGIEFGFFFHENSRSFEVVFYPSGVTQTGKVDLRGLYLAPGLRAAFHTRSRVEPMLGIAPALCLLDAAVLVGSGFSPEEYPNTTALCVQGTAGVEILFGKDRPRWALRGEARLRWSNFGELPAFGPGSGSLGGTAWGIQVGGVLLK